MDTKTSVQNAILIKGARIFDGQSPDLIEGSDVLIENNKVTRIGKNITAPDGGWHSTRSSWSCWRSPWMAL